MLSQNDIDDLENRFRDVFTTKEEFQNLKSDIFDKLDDFLKEVRDSHEERVVVSGQVSGLSDRIEKLESFHTN